MTDRPDPTPPPFARSTLETLVGRLVAIVARLSILVLVAAALGPEGQGAYALTLVVSALLLLGFGFGLGSASTFRVARDRSRAPQVAGTAVALSLILGGLALGIGAFVVIPTAHLWLTGVPRLAIVAALLGLPLTLLGTSLQGVLLGLGWGRGYNVHVAGQALLALGLVGLSLYYTQTGVVGAVAAVAIAHGTAALALVVALRARLGPFRWDLSGPAVRDLLGFGAKAHLASLVQFLNYRVDLLLVNGLAGTGAAGVYAIATQLSEQVWHVAEPASLLLMPRVASRTSDPGFTERVFRQVLVLTVIAGLGLALLAPWIVDLLWGASYQGAVVALWILLPGVVVTGGAKILGNDIVGRGRPGLNLVAAASGLIINVGLNLVFIPRFGIRGAAAATLVSYGVIALACLLIQRRLAGRGPGALIPTPADLADWPRLLRRGLGGRSDPTRPVE